MRTLLLALLATAAPAPAQDHAHMGHAMNGMYGPYPMSREASGTSWQPDSTPHEGLHMMSGDWMLMLHGYAVGAYTCQGGPRGDDKAFSASMLMLMGQRPLGAGTLGLRGMFSLDPAMGAHGYPLLLQTGETADGATPLVDRQHPHDLLMELSASYSVPVGGDGSVFAYAGLPGEPALGPPAFMHRLSGVDDPEAPLTHHWLDSTHVAFGVTTVGAVWKGWKLEGSAFKGREPDEKRWNFDSPKLDSFAGRLSVNPTPDWALQVSHGRLRSPEQLEPEADVDRWTASASANTRWSLGVEQQTTLAFGRNRALGGRDLDALLLESALRADGLTVFSRAERIEKDELIPSGPTFTVYKLSLGAVYDFAEWKRSRWGVGVVGGIHLLPSALRPVYGAAPLSGMVFARVKLI